MSRILCIGCQRPQKACICAFTIPVANDVHVVVLQHPSEVAQTKGTVALLAKSLQSCQVLIGESFDQDPDFLQVLAQYQALLLYPGEQAKVLSCQQNIQHSQVNTKPLCLILLDGTWKKAYRMFMLSAKLSQLPQVALPEHLAKAGQYHIRKVAKKNALSSLEACCYALAILEAEHDMAPCNSKANNICSEQSNQARKYKPLLEKFNQFNQFQLSFRPEHR